MTPVDPEVVVTLSATYHSGGGTTPTIWNFELSCGSGTGSGTLKDPFDAADEEDLRWLLEDYAASDPYKREKAAQVTTAVRYYANRLLAQLESPLRAAVGITFDNAISIPIYLKILALGSQQNSVHALHWEALELVADQDFNIVRIIDPAPVSVSIHRKSTLETDFPWLQAAVDPDVQTTSAPSASVRNPIISSPSADGGPFRILFLTARNTSVDDTDISYRLIAKYAHAAVSTLLDVELDFVRPGTYKALEEALANKPKGYYSVVHLDTHGRVKGDKAWVYLISSDDSTALVKISAGKLGALLAREQTRTVVLNACESATSDKGLESNLAAILIRCGVHCVVGMSYKLLVPSASIFVPLFYQQLLQNHDVAAAVHSTRKCMIQDMGRAGILNFEVELPDAIVPVVYQSSEAKDVAAPNPKLSQPILRRAWTTPVASVRQEEISTSAAIIGRDLDLLRLETDLALSSHVVELRAIIGAGKSAFLHFATDWWLATRFINTVVWIDCGETDTKNNLTNLMDIDKYIASKLSKEPNPSLRSPSSCVLEETQKQSVLVLDHADTLIAKASGIEKAEFRKRLLAYHDLYVVIALGTGTGATLDLPPLRLLPLGDTVALELAQACLSERGISFPDANDLQYLRGCLAILGHNPLAIRTVLNHYPKKRKYSIRTLFQDLQLPSPSCPFLAAIMLTEVGKIADSILPLLQKTPEKSIFMAMGQSRDRIRKDPSSLVASMLFDEILPPNGDALDMGDQDQSMARYIEFTMADRNFQGLKSEFGKEAYFRNYLQFNPYRREFNTVVSHLRARGVATSDEKRDEFWILQPLLPYAITARAMKFDMKGYQKLSSAFNSSYRVMSAHWDTTQLIQLWGVQPPPPLNPNGWRSQVSQDFLNCITAVRSALRNSPKLWLQSFPWNLLVALGVHYLTIFRSDVPPYEKTIVIDILTDFLHQWNKLSYFNRARNQVRYVREQALVAPRENGGGAAGALTATQVAICLFRHHSFGYDSISITRSWFEILRLWRILFTLFPQPTQQESGTVDMLRTIAYLRGFIALSNPPTEVRRQEFLKDMSNVPLAQGVSFSPGEVFDEGVSEATYIMSCFAAFTLDELDELDEMSVIDPDSSTIGREDEGHKIEKSYPIPVDSRDVVRDGESSEHSVGARDVHQSSYVEPAELSYEWYTAWASRRRPKLAFSDMGLIGRLAKSQAHQNSHDAMASHVSLAQRMMIREEWQDALEQFIAIENLLGKGNEQAASRSKSSGLDPRHSSVFLATQLILKANVQRALNNYEEAQGTLLRIRDMIGLKDPNVMERQVLHQVFMGLELLDYFKPKTNSGSLTEDQITGLIEYGCLSWDQSIDLAPSMTIHLERTVRTVDKAYHFESIEPDGGVFLLILSAVAKTAWNNRDGQRRRSSILSGAFGGSNKVQDNYTLFKRLCQKMMYADVNQIDQLLSYVLVEYSRVPDDLPEEERDATYEAIFIDAEKVLFGNEAICTNLKYLKAFEGRPIRQKDAKTSWWQWSTANANEEQQKQLALLRDWRLVRKAKT